MLKNYFILALRSFYRDRTYAAINLVGLALAFGAVLLLIGYIRYELSFDRHFTHADRATTPDISALFTKDFVILILFAIVIAWWGMTRWLEEYAYRTELSGWIFGLTALSVTVVSLIIINMQVILSTGMNPVESLRTE